MASKKKKITESEPSLISGTPQDRALAALYGNAGVNAGNALAEKYLPDGSLGRVSTEIPGQSEYLAQLKAGLGGYTSPEYQAQREQMMQGINSNTQTGLAELAKAQARGKVYGAASSAQQANLLTGAQNSKNDLEQKLMVQNIDESQKRLNNYGAQNAAAQAANLEREKLNLGQMDAEKAAQIGAFTGAAGTALTAAQTKAAQKIQKEGIAKLA